MRRLGPALFVALPLLAGCGSGGTPAPARTHEGKLTEAAARAAAAPVPIRQHPFPGGAALRRAIAGYLATRPLHAGLYIQDLRTGATYGYREHSRYITASVAKVNILTGLLLQRQRQHRELTRPERATATQMIRYSDNNAANALYAEAGQGTQMSRIDRRLGMKHTVPYPVVWGATHTCPYDQVKLLRVLTDQRSPLSPAHRRYVLGLMHTVTPEQAWGISAAARPGEKVALKNGWVPMHLMGTGWEVNSIGRITGREHDFLIAVFTAGAPDMGIGVQTAEHLATLAVAALR